VGLLFKFCGSLGVSSWKSEKLSSLSCWTQLPVPGLRSYPWLTSLANGARCIPSLKDDPGLMPT
jgi:hypothetical protein